MICHGASALLSRREHDKCLYFEWLGFMNLKTGPVVCM